MFFDYIDNYFKGAISLINKLNHKEVEKTVGELIKLKKRKGRLFLLGVGGSAANCSHAVNDFRKICGIEAYTPVDNVSELTARTNDNGWETVFVDWLKDSYLTKKDAVMVFSVGGGSVEKNISVNIVKALQYAQKIGSSILGIVSRDGGYTKKVADVCIQIPVISEEKITPYAESFQAIIWHAIVNYPKLHK
ncbi:SIS domain-containing protein [Candidatus Gottesmanbacteria bacterium]|nr:SIS domain-containing protein [Candidatus Gottesmanbacteria bacterium]